MEGTKHACDPAGMIDAPEGAMQFEITLDRLELKGTRLWVKFDRARGSVYGNPPGCACKPEEYFRVLRTIWTPRPLTGDEASSGNLVCRCIGRLVE